MKTVTVTLFCLSLLTSALATEKPNILWIIVEDMSCHFGYQGEKLVHTPNVDKLAGEGVVFENAYVAAPVCSASRSGMITGMYQTSIGAHNHRSSRGTHNIQLPKGIKTIPEIFKANGYYTCNSQENPKRYGKEDYNFVYSRKALYNAPGWPSGQRDSRFLRRSSCAVESCAMLKNGTIK